MVRHKADRLARRIYRLWVASHRLVDPHWHAIPVALVASFAFVALCVAINLPLGVLGLWAVWVVTTSMVVGWNALGRRLERRYAPNALEIARLERELGLAPTSASPTYPQRQLSDMMIARWQEVAAQRYRQYAESVPTAASERATEAPEDSDRNAASNSLHIVSQRHDAATCPICRRYVPARGASSVEGETRLNTGECEWT